MTDLEFTGERFVPGKSPALIEAEHLARYFFALEYVKGQKVLDLGCGEGYGSNMLAGVAESVVGVDIDTVSIVHARETYKSGNLNFAEADVCELPYNDGEFSAVVSFEVVEHIRDPKGMLREASRVLRQDGILIVSTPNGAVKVTSAPNPFHLKEYALDEFNFLIREVFPESRWNLGIYGQFLEGKRYSSLGVAIKNTYLTIKESLGLTEPLLAKPDTESASSQINYTFQTAHARLAEYLVAIALGRG
jgi:2-polyprenyl-3-methyl-5-hydroxy-6-metoxy-1,4-benzoquinol methylase